MRLPLMRTSTEMFARVSEYRRAASAFDAMQSNPNVGIDEYERKRTRYALAGAALESLILSLDPC